MCNIHVGAFICDETQPLLCLDLRRAEIAQGFWLSLRKLLNFTLQISAIFWQTISRTTKTNLP